MLEKITDLYKDSYYVWGAKRWAKYKSEGALKAVTDYLMYSALGFETTFCEYWSFRMRDADTMIYGTFREFLIESGCPTEEEISDGLNQE